MIYPMMMKVDFLSVKNVGKNPKGLFVTWAANWLIKPFTMYAVAAFFLNVVFSKFIEPGLAKEYLAGAILLGAAPCPPERSRIISPIVLGSLASNVGPGMQNIIGVMSQAYWVKPATAEALVAGATRAPPRTVVSTEPKEKPTVFGLRKKLA